MQFEEINFTYNWNNKLFCNSFTTLRLENKNRKVSMIFKITLLENKEQKFVSHAQIIDKKTISIDEINNYISFLDTGYSPEDTKKILRKMYPKVDFSITKLDFILFNKVKIS